MKEKYCYESVKDEITWADAPPVAFIGLLVIAFIIRDSHDNWVFFTLISIAFLILICWIAFYRIEGIFIADDNAVTFGRIHKKRIEYSSIRSIDLKKEVRSYKTSVGYRAKVHKKYTSFVEIITFHCEGVDYSFACVLVQNHEYKSPGEPLIEYNKDWSNSAFSRLKTYIESRNIR